MVAPRAIPGERMAGRISVILADDHAMVRHGLRLLLESEPDITVIGEAADGLEVASLVERLGPDVLVLDIVMPGLNGLDVAKEVARRSPATRPEPGGAARLLLPPRKDPCPPPPKNRVFLSAPRGRCGASGSWWWTTTRTCAS